MRVLEAMGEPFAFGGEEAFIMNLLTHMDLSDIRADVLTPYFARNETNRDIVQRLGGQVYSLGLEFKPGASRDAIADPLSDFLSKEHYDVIHVHTGSISVMSIMAQVAKDHGVRKVVVHSHFGQRRDLDSVKHRAVRLVYGIQMAKNVDVYCACTKVAAETMFRKQIVDHNTVIIRNGIDLERFSFDPSMREKMRLQLGLNPDSIVVGHVGRFAYEKNHPFLLEVFAKFSEIDCRARLLMLGDGDEMEEDKRLADTLGIIDRCIFAGNVSNVCDYLQAMDVFCFPSHFEGLGIACIEAEANGLPVLASSAIPKDIELVSNVHRLPLTASSQEWANQLLSLTTEGRNCGDVLSLKAAGYDARDMAAQVRTIYEAS